MTETVRVLLIEDNPGDVRLVERLLSLVADTTFLIETASRMETGLARLGHPSIDAVLLDLSLPDSDPQQSFHAVRGKRPDLPIVVLTGRQDRDLAVEVVRAGAQDVISKRSMETDRLSRAILFAIERSGFYEAMRRREERLSLVLDGTQEGVWDWDLESNRVDFSARWKALLGHAPAEVGADPWEWTDRVHPEDRQRLDQELAAHREGLTPQLRVEHRLRMRSGHYRWMLVRGRVLRDESGTAHRMVGSLSDIHERKLNEARLQHDAFHDALTGLANTTLLSDRLAVSIAHSHRRPAYQFALLYFDLDDFKAINDRYGHVIGDQCLAAVARRLEKVLRPGDTFARVGGDEFAILADDLDDPGNAKRLAERIRRELDAPFHVDGRELRMSASIGVTLSSGGYEQAADVVKDADAAMYRAKTLGSGRHALFDPEMHRRAVEQLRMEADLRRAVERREFQLHYQPIVALASGKIEGFEALLRWRHPTRGLVYPAEFIPLAEQTGLILPIGWIVMDQACRQAVIWHHRYAQNPLVMSVNLSPRQFTQAALVERLAEVLKETGLPPDRLRVEITEQPLLDNADLARERLDALSKLKVRISIDGFGTCPSSLSDLHYLPAETIKIHRSLIRRVRTGEDGKVVGTLVALARNLGMRSAAEGLETEEQVARLRELDCDAVQGYYFSAPLDGAGAEALLAYQPPW